MGGGGGGDMSTGGLPVSASVSSRGTRTSRRGGLSDQEIQAWGTEGKERIHLNDDVAQSELPLRELMFLLPRFSRGLMFLLPGGGGGGGILGEIP